MGNLNFVLTYLQSCLDGKLALSECGPAWQFGVIAVLLLLAISALVVIRLKSGMQASPA